MLGAPRPSAAPFESTKTSQQQSWWKNASTVVDLFRNSEGNQLTYDWYRIVEAALGIESQDVQLQKRFRQLYGEFSSERPKASEQRLWLRCRVQVQDDVAARLVTFTASEALDVVAFLLKMYHDRGYIELQAGEPGWRSFGVVGTARPLLMARGTHVLVDAKQRWQPLIATCAMNWVMRMQRDWLFFHAASVGIDGSGVMITGKKGAGKTTLSMALAVEGHDFLGDEIAALRSRTLELTPFRRAVAIRPGLQAHRVEELLKDGSFSTEPFPDGTTRTRAEASKLFPRPVAQSLPLRSVFFLREFETTPRAERFLPRTADLHQLTLMPGTMGGASCGQQIMEMAKLLSSVHCYYLYPGSPEATAGLVEEIVRTE